MTIKIIVSSAVVSAVVSLISTFINAHLSRKSAIEAAKEVTQRELEKLERTWDREDIVSSDEEFAEMAAAVSKFATYATGAWNAEAISCVSSVRAKEHGNLGQIMDKLYDSVKNDLYREADKHLTEAINEKRKIKQSR